MLPSIANRLAGRIITESIYEPYDVVLRHTCNHTGGHQDLRNKPAMGTSSTTNTDERTPTGTGVLRMLRIPRPMSFASLFL